MKKYHTVPHCSNELIAVVLRNRYLFTYKSTPFSLLKNESLIEHTSTTVSYKICMNACKQVGFEPKGLYKGYRPKNILDLLAKGMVK